MNLINDYQPLVKNQADYLSYRFNTDRDDLEQEGNLMLWRIQTFGMLGDNAKAISAYIKLRVIGAMKTYIAKNLGPVAVPSSAFWESGETAKEAGIMEETYPCTTSLNPEDEYLSKESATEFDMKVKALKALLTPKEIVVFEGILMAEEPLTTRDMADAMGVNSPQTVVNIRNRISKKAEGIFNEEV